MRIGDAAAAAGATPRALRFYEANDLLSPPRRTRAGQRVYGPREVARLRAIRELLLLGLTVADIRNCADRLDLLEGDTLPPYGGPGACAADRDRPAPDRSARRRDCPPHCAPGPARRPDRRRAWPERADDQPPSLAGDNAAARLRRSPACHCLGTS